MDKLTESQKRTEQVMDDAELRTAVAAIDWYHSIQLRPGLVTPGRNKSASALQNIRMPASFAGKTVLDVGAWDGFYSFEAERRGAARVVALDTFAWDERSGSAKSGFELARRALNSRVEDVEVEVLDISPDTVGTFDVVLFLGVLYHMRHPLLALEHVASVTKEMAIVETATDMRFSRTPVMAFYPERTRNNDSTNWWGPNPAAVKAMLHEVGFRKVVEIQPPSRIRAAARPLRRMWRERSLKPRLLSRDRATFHAWK